MKENPSASKARVIAFYLPQFHPIPENDQWWGKGFTEWTNVAKARPLYPGHYQPRIPGDLGFYDLRVPETRTAQADLAREYGIEAFCYYHYWFAGKRILERPFNEVLQSGEPDFPFCLCWANHSWTGVWAGCPGKTLIEQTYPGERDHRAHFDLLLQAFSDRRYLKVDGKPLFLIYEPMRIPDVERMTNLWRELAQGAGLKGIFLVGMGRESNWNPNEYGFDAATPKDRLPELKQPHSSFRTVNLLRDKVHSLIGKPTVYLHRKVLQNWIYREEGTLFDNFPCLVPNWDNTPRSGSNGLVLHGSTPELFRLTLRNAIQTCRQKLPERRLIFIKSWNEWAEGNYLEPDLKFGRAYLEVIQDELNEAGG